MSILKKVMLRLMVVLLLAGSMLPVFVPEKAVATANGTAIIADHTVVDKYNQIPAKWIAAVKKMYLNIPGESHSRGYMNGLKLLMLQDPTYQASVIVDDGVPQPYREDALRVNRLVWDPLNGWTPGAPGTGIPGTGEERWYTWHAWDPSDPHYLIGKQIPNHIDYCNTNNLTIAAIGFGWCYDMSYVNDPGGGLDPIYGVHWAGTSEGGPDGNMRWGLDDGDSTANMTGNLVNMDDYLQATQGYIDYVQSKGYDTKVFFTTGPVDTFDNSEAGYQREIKQQYIRNYVTAHGEILFDYADILTYSDSDPNNQFKNTWNGHSYPQIHPDNMKNLDGNPGYGYEDHIGEVGELRLGKALWWLLARLAGWDGTPASSDTQAPSVTINSPNGGEKFKAGCQYNITWTATDNIGVTSCNISYSTDNGTSYTDIATGLTNSGTYSWTVPNTPLPTSLVRVSASDPAGNWGQDASNAVFQIFSFIPGDANNDCTVTIQDITKVERIILEVDTPTPDTDANADGDINALDITKIEQIILSP